MWNPDAKFWAKYTKVEPDHHRPVVEGPPILDRDHPAAPLCPPPRPTPDLVRGLLASFGIPDPGAYLDMTVAERERRRQERIDKWMRGEELD